MKIIKIILALTLVIVFSWQNRLFSKPEALAEAYTDSKEEIGVSAVEDLMREHGILRRILLIYEEIYRCLNKNKKIDSTVILEASRIVHDFIENYHEKLEEEYIFPKFKKSSKLFNTVDTLKRQHQIGRKITNNIMRIANGKIQDQKKQKELMHYIALFVRMYRPHAAREDTVLFPAFKIVVTEGEYNGLGDKFEEIEAKLFGPQGFEKTVDKVANLEKKLGIYNLSQFTPLNVSEAK